MISFVILAVTAVGIVGMVERYMTYMTCGIAACKGVGIDTVLNSVGEQRKKQRSRWILYRS